MNRVLRVLVALASVAMLASLPMAAAAQDEPKDLTFYVVTHGAASDPYWVIVNDAAVQAGVDLGVKVNVSFAQNDIAAQKESFNAAIAAGADGIAVSSPETGAFVEETQAALAAGIPVVYLDTDDPTSGRLAYVGANLFTLGTTWASFLVDNGFLKEGDFVWMPVEVPGAAYQVLATEGISSIFDPLGIKYEVFDAKYDPIETLNNMLDYLTANGDQINAMIGLGDMVTGFTQKAFERVGWEAGHIPVVGWGNSYDTATAVKAGFVNAAMWQFPDAQGYMPIYMLYMAAQGNAINYQVLTSGLYTADNADTFITLTEKLQSR
jgi:simple sugar transport system substrate-binding protein